VLLWKTGGEPVASVTIGVGGGFHMLREPWNLPCFSVGCKHRAKTPAAGFFKQVRPAPPPGEWPVTFACGRTQTSRLCIDPKCTEPYTYWWTDWSVHGNSFCPPATMSDRNGFCSEDPDKRLAILEQAMRTFAELGFRGTDVQVIANRAGVGKGTVYRYFHSKEDLFWAATFEVLLRLEKHAFGAMEGVEGTCAKIRASSIAYAKFFETNPQCLEMFVQNRAEFRGAAPESHREYQKKMMQRLESIIQEGIESGELRQVDPFQTTHGIGSLLYGTVVVGCHLTSLSAVEMVEYNIDIFLRGIRADVSSGSKLVGSFGS